MAKLPTTIGRNVPRATRRIASADFSEGQAGFRSGAQIMKAGFDDLGRGLQAASEILYEEQLKDEERAVKNLDNEWAKQRRIILFGDGTPTNQGFYATAGEDTLNSRKGVEDKLNKARQQLLQKAGNGRIKEAFDFRSTATLEQELEGVDRFTTAQRKEANTATSKATIEEAVQSAATYYSDQGKWEAAVDVIASEVASMGDNEGWSQELVNNATQKAISAAARDRINRAMIVDAKSAETIYADTKDMIDGDMRIQIEQDIKQAHNAERIQEEHAAAMARLAAEEASEAAKDEYVSSFLTGGSVDLKSIGQDRRLKPTDKLILANMLKADADSEGVPTGVSQANTAELFGRLTLPDTDSRKITNLNDINQAFINKQIKRTDLDWLVTQFNNVRTPQGEKLTKVQNDFLANVKSSITSSTFFKTSAAGDTRYYQFMQYVTDQVNKATENKEDPYELFRPGSPKFLGSPHVISQFKPTQDELTAELMGEIVEPAQITNPRGLPRIKTGEEYDNLAPGSAFVDDRDGNIKRKPAAK